MVPLLAWLPLKTAMTRKRETQAFRDQQADAIDRNPSIPCDVCGEQYPYQDYWEEHIDEITPETTWRCKDCLNELIAQAMVEKRKDRNANIGDFA